MVGREGGERERLLILSHMELPEKFLAKDAAINRPVLEKLRELSPDGGNEIVVRVIAAYLVSSAENMDSVRKAAAEEDVILLRGAAHTLKSSSASLGALTLSGICADIEAAARAEDFAAGCERVAALEDEYGRVREELESLAPDG